MPDISVIMAYHSRPIHLRNTLNSYRHFYPDLDYEVVIVDDSSYRKDELLKLIEEYEDIPIKTEYLDRRKKTVRGPGVVMNRAAELSEGKLIALTNPENMHCGPVLTDAAERLSDGPGAYKRGEYLVYGCMTLKEIPGHFMHCVRNPGQFADKGCMGGWYIHSVHHPRKFHFMSVIERSDWFDVGGFDPAFDDGCGYDDDDLVKSIEAKGIQISLIDEPFVAHQWHSREHWDFREATRRNCNLYTEKWGAK